jgi:hypothetical protein
MKLGFIFTATVVLGIFTADAAVFTISGPTINPANGHAYYLLSNGNWTDSEAAAQALGGHLVTINNAAENAFVLANFSNFGAIQRSIWIGFNDAASEGNFVWASGEAVTYTNWRAGEPNNNLGLENYAYILNEGQSWDGQWNDFQNQPVPTGQAPLYGVVEVVPEPSMLALGALGMIVCSRRRLKTR